MQFMTNVLLLSHLNTLLNADTVKKMYGSAAPLDDLTITADEVYAETRLRCATMCVERGCSSILYTDTAGQVNYTLISYVTQQHYKYFVDWYDVFFC